MLPHVVGVAACRVTIERLRTTADDTVCPEPGLIRLSVMHKTKACGSTRSMTVAMCQWFANPSRSQFRRRPQGALTYEEVGQVEDTDAAVTSIVVIVESKRKIGGTSALGKETLKRHNLSDGALIER